MNRFWIRVLGIFGVLGGLILFAGDMLFYYDSSNANMRENMGNAADFRIISSGITALLAAWFYMLGAFHVYHAFKPTKPAIKKYSINLFRSYFNCVRCYSWPIRCHCNISKISYAKQP